jgi:hypothetical protein
MSKPKYESTFAMIEAKANRLAAIVYGVLTSKDHEGNWLTASDLARHLRTRQRVIENALIDLAKLGLIRVNSKEMVAA